ncbi:hypothetical protein JCM11251_006498 [Rhodosporidiobolus azoricus]
MFALGKALNPYDEIINKATDEKQTEINWEIALTVWDKVNEDGETGARNCVQALQKRLNHRSANVQLFSLTLAGALVNNCGPALHREISGKTFTQTLVRLINDRTTHDTVRRSALSTLETIIKEHPNDPNFDLLLETYESLKRQGVVFPSAEPAASSSGSRGAGGGEGGRNGARGEDEDEVLRREEEELQRALAESAALADPMRGYQKRGASPSRQSTSRPSEGGFGPPSVSEGKKTPQRVRALFDFQGQTSEELQLRRGEEVRVLEEVSDQWWRGESLDGRGRVGIFPVNYVEPLPDLPPPVPSHQSSLSSYSQPPPHQRQQEGEEDLEASIFAQAASIDRLLNLMGQLRARGEDFAESQELTDLYNSSMRLRPKVVQLLRKYEQKQADLHSLSDKVQHAKSTYEQYVGIAPPPQQQAQQQHPYAPPQQNGFHPHPHQQQQPHPVQPQEQQHPPPLAAASPVPQGHPAHPVAETAQTEEQREYERKYAEYLRQLEDYNRQMAQIAQQQGHPPSSSAGGAPPPSQDPHQQQQAYYAQQQQLHHAADPYAQQQQQGPRPSVGFPAPASTDPHPAPSSSSIGSPTPSAAPAQAQPQPIWDAATGQWVWPTQHAALAGAVPAGQDAGGYPHHQQHVAPAPALSPVPVPAQGQGYPAQAQPYPVSSPAAAGGAAGLEGGMAALSVGGSGVGPGSPPLQQAYQQQQPLGHVQPQQDQEHAAAWAAYHAAQAQAQAQGQVQQ